MDHERYEIIKLLGKGRTGGVYETKDLTLQRDVAIRRFFSVTGETDHSAWEDQFLHIAHNLCNLQHPNLLTVFDAGVDDDGAYLITQHILGIKLSGQLIDNPLSEWDVHELASQLLDGLSTAHAAGFIHGALTAGSIHMVQRARGGHRFIIMDLGLAKLAPLIQGSNSDLGVMADPALTAPEMFSGSPPSVQSDLFMLAQVCYLCLAQGHPLAGLSPEQIATFYESSSLQPLSDYRPDLNPEFITWIHHLSAKDPADRPQSAAEALRSLPKISPPAPQPASSTTASAPAQSNSVKLQLNPATPITSTVQSTPSTHHQPQLSSFPTKKKSKSGLIVGFIIAAACIAAVIFFAIPRSKNAAEAPSATPATPATPTDTPASTKQSDPKKSPLESLFVFNSEHVYKDPYDKPTHPMHLILDDEDALDWVVYTGVPFDKNKKQHSKHLYIQQAEIIGDFQPSEKVNSNLLFTIDIKNKIQVKPGIHADSKNHFKNKKKNGYKITLRTPNDSSSFFTITPHLTGSNTDIKIRFKDKNDKQIGEDLIIATPESFSLAQRIDFEKFSPNATLIMEITTTGAKDGKKPFSLSLNAIKITD